MTRTVLEIGLLLKYYHFKSEVKKLLIITFSTSLGVEITFLIFSFETSSICIIFCLRKLTAAEQN